MKFGKAGIYLLVILLLLELLKSLLSGIGFVGFYYFSTMVAAIQFLLVPGYLLFFLFKGILRQIIHGSKINWCTVFIIVVVFASAELIFGYWLNNPSKIPAMLSRSYKYYYDYYDCRLLQYEEASCDYDSGLYYRLRPNGTFFYRNREFNNKYTVNSAGLRDLNTSLNAPAVICLGDSYTMGWGVNQDEVFAKELQAMSGLSVLNAGISSYGTFRETKLFNRLDTSGLKYIVIQYCSNDIIENSMAINNDFRLPISSKKTFDSLQQEHTWVRKYFPGKHFLTIGSVFAKQQFNKLVPFFKIRLDRENVIQNAEEHAKYFLDIICSTDLAKAQAKIIVTELDSYTGMKNKFLKQLEILQQKEPYASKLVNKLIIADMSSILDQNDFYDLDLHINNKGHKKVAGALWQVIQKN